MSISTSGAAGGHIVLQTNDVIPGVDILPFHPEIQSVLDEIEKQGWRYIFVDTRATAVAEVDLAWCNYSIKPANPGDPAPEVHNSPENLLELDIGTLPLTITAIPKVETFSVSVSAKDIPRAATVDLVSGVVTQVSDQFLKWEQGWEKDQRRLSEGLETYEIVSWLLDVKGYHLAESISPERYQESAKTLGGLRDTGSAPTSSD